MKSKKMGVIGLAMAIPIALGLAAAPTALQATGAINAPGASAHNIVLDGNAVCQSDGTRTITWTMNWSNVPQKAELESKVITHASGTKLGGGSIPPADAQLQLSWWTQHANNGPSVFGVGKPDQDGNIHISFVQTGVSGTATSATVTVQNDWTDGFPSSDDQGKVTFSDSCTPTVPSATCKVAGTPYTESDDKAPILTTEGAKFDGHAGQATGYRIPVTGNLQGWTPLSFDATDLSQFFFRIVVDTSADTGGKTYQSLSFGGQSTIDKNSTIDQFGKTIAQLAAEYPHNQLKSIGFQTNSAAPTTYESILKSVTTDCGSFPLLPPKPGPKQYTTTDQVCAADNSGTGTVTTHYWEQDSAWDVASQAYVYGEPYEYKDATQAPTSAGTCPVTFSTCKATTELPTATPSNPLGWGDLLHGTWVSGGIDLKATSSEEAYAYVDLDAAHQFKFSDIGNLTTSATNVHGTSAIIMQATGGQNIHVEANGTYWTIHPGLFPETAPGYYSTKSPQTAGQTLSNPTITEVAVWVNPGDEVVLHAQNYHCLTQPFDVDRAPMQLSTSSQTCTAGVGTNTVTTPVTNLADYVTTWNGAHTVATVVATPTANNGFLPGNGYTLNADGTATQVITFPNVVCIVSHPIALALTGSEINIGGVIFTIDEVGWTAVSALALGVIAVLMSVVMPAVRRRRGNQV